MASYNNINDLKKIIYLILFGLPVIASMDIDCNGKPFHCVNSSHFMICVDLGGGVSQTIDNFLISCPPTTECRRTNHFECEYVRLTTTVKPVQSSSVRNDVIENVKVDWEKIDLTTTMPSHRTSDLELSEKYFNGLSIPTIPIQISATNVNTNEVTTEELYNNDNNTSVVTTPSYFMKSNGPTYNKLSENVQEKSKNNLDVAERATSSTDTIVTTATLQPHPGLTLESTTKPKVTVEAYTESVGFPVTEIYQRSSDVDEIKKSSKIPDGTSDVTEKSTLFVFFTPDTPYHEEYRTTIQLNPVIETKTSRTITNNSNNVSDTYEKNTTLDATTFPDTILDLITPKSGITVSENNFNKATIKLENINLTNPELEKTIPVNSTGSSVIIVAQTPNNLSSSGSEISLATDIYVDATTRNFVFDEYSTVKNTVDISIVNKLEKISAEPTPNYTIPYPVEEPLHDNIILNSVAADFENNTPETPIFTTTSEMVSDNQNESTVTSDLTHTSTFTEPKSLENIKLTFEGAWIAKESSANTVLLSNASKSLIDTEVTNNTNKSFDNRPIVSIISKEREFNVTKHNDLFFPNNINIPEKLLKNTEQFTTLSFNMNKDSEGTKYKLKANNTKDHPKQLKINEQLSNQSFHTGIETTDLTTDQNVDFGLNNLVNNSLNTQSAIPSVYPNGEKSYIYFNASSTDILLENLNPNITLNDVDTGKSVNVNFTLFDKSPKKHFTSDVMTDESPSSPPPSNPEMTISISTSEDTFISPVIPPLILTTSNPQSEISSSTATETTVFNPSTISSSTTKLPTASEFLDIQSLDLTSQEKSKPISILSPIKSSDLSDATASIFTEQVLYDSPVMPGSISIPYSTIAINEIIATTPVTMQPDDSDSLSFISTQNIVSSQPDATKSLTSLDDDYTSSIGPLSTSITQTPINSNIPPRPLYTSVDPFLIFNQQTIFKLLNASITLTDSGDDTKPSVTTLPILNSHISSQPVITKVYNEEDYNTIVTPSTLNLHPNRSVTNYYDNFNPSVGPSSTLNIHTSDSQIPERAVTNLQDNSIPSIVQSSTSNPHTSNTQILASLVTDLQDNSFQSSNPQTGTRSSVAAELLTNYQDDPNLPGVESLNSTSHSSNSQIPESSGTNLQDNLNPSIVQSATTSKLPASGVTNLQDNSIPSIVQSSTLNPQTSNSQILASPHTNLQDNSIPSIVQSSNLHSSNSQIPAISGTNLQDNINSSVVQSATSTPHSLNSQIPASSGTNLQNNFNPSIVQSATSNPHSSNSQFAESSGTNLQDNYIPSIVQSSTFNSQILASPHTNLQDNSIPSIVQSATSNPLSSNSQIPKSSGTNLQNNFNPSIVQSATSNPHSSNSQIAESSGTNLQDNSIPSIVQFATTAKFPASEVTNLKDNFIPSIVQSSTLKPHTSNSQILTSPHTNLQDNSIPSIVQFSTPNPYNSNAQIPEISGTYLQGNIYPSVVQSATSTPHSPDSYIPASSGTNLQNNFNPSIVQSATSNSHSSNSQIPKSSGTNLLDNSNPSIEQFSTLNTNNSTSHFPASPHTNLQDNSIPSIVQSSTPNPHSSNSQIPEISGTTLQGNINPSVVQSATSTPHSPNSHIPASSSTNLQNHFYPSIVQSATSNPHSSNSQIPKSSGKNLLDNSNPSIEQFSTLNTHTSTSQFSASQVTNLQNNSIPLIKESSISNPHTASSAVDTGPPTNNQENFNPSVVQSSTSNLHSPNSQVPARQVTKVQDNSIPSIVQFSTLNPHTSNSQIPASPVTNRQDNSNPSINQSSISNPDSGSSSVAAGPTTNYQENVNPSVVQYSTSNPQTSNPQIPASSVTNIQEHSIAFVLPTTSSNLNITPSPKDSLPSLLKASTSNKQLGFNPNPHTASNLNASAKPFTTLQDNSKTFVVPSLISQQHTSRTPVLTVPDTVIPKPVVTLPILSPRNISQEGEQPQTPSFTCENKYRGRYADNKDCSKFYICIGIGKPIVGICPVNTVFSELRKQCTKNLSHCVRENEFQCVSEGRFGDVSKNNIYYICIRNSEATYVRFKFQCQLGYHLNKTTVKCTENVITPKSRASVSSSIDSTSKVESEVVSMPENKDSIEIQSNKDKRDFECESEGKFAHPSNCRKYFVCKKKKSVFRRKSKKCDSDEVFHKEKKKCVDADSYDC